MGATSALGTSIVEALCADPRKRINAVVGVVRHVPADHLPDVEWQVADSPEPEAIRHLRGVDALVHASRADGGRAGGGRTGAGRGDASAAAIAVRQVLEAAAEADIHHVVQLSSFLAYSPPATPGDAVDESWPTGGLTDSVASRSAAAVERCLDEFATDHEVVRLVRIRPGLVLGPRVRQHALRRAGLLAGPLRMLEHLPLVPGIDLAGLPVVHHDDLAAAVTSSVSGPAFGAYNVALDEPLRLSDVARALGARPVLVPARLARRTAAVADAVFERVRRRQGPVSAWLDTMAQAPRLDTTRARESLDWLPLHTVEDSLRSTLGDHGAPGS